MKKYVIGIKSLKDVWVYNKYDFYDDEYPIPRWDIIEDFLYFLLDFLDLDGNPKMLMEKFRKSGFLDHSIIHMSFIMSAKNGSYLKTTLDLPTEKVDLHKNVRMYMVKSLTSSEGNEILTERDFRKKYIFINKN